MPYAPPPVRLPRRRLVVIGLALLALLSLLLAGAGVLVLARTPGALAGPALDPVPVDVPVMIQVGSSHELVAPFSVSSAQRLVRSQRAPLRLTTSRWLRCRCCSAGRDMRQWMAPMGQGRSQQSHHSGHSCQQLCGSP